MTRAQQITAGCFPFPTSSAPHSPPALSCGKLTSPLHTLGVVALWLPAGFGQWEVLTGNGRGREERGQGVHSLGLATGSCSVALFCRCSSHRNSSNCSLCPSRPMGGRGFPALAGPRMLHYPIPISLNAVHTFVNSPFVYTPMNHLFK